jgi:hypothetical protein
MYDCDPVLHIASFIYLFFDAYSILDRANDSSCLFIFLQDMPKRVSLYITRKPQIKRMENSWCLIFFEGILGA